MSKFSHSKTVSIKRFALSKEILPRERKSESIVCFAARRSRPQRSSPSKKKCPEAASEEATQRELLGSSAAVDASGETSTGADPESLRS